VPLHIYTINGILCVNKAQVPRAGGDAGGGAGGGDPVMPGDGGDGGTWTGTGNRAVLQSILLNQHLTHGTMALMQTQTDQGFATMKTFMQRQHAMIKGNNRRFGCRIQGGFACQDPRQAADRRQGDAKNLQPGARDGTPELTPNFHTLEDLWNEWKFGLGGRKTAEQFTPTERGGGQGHRGKKMKYCRRKKIWTLQQRLVAEGRSPQEVNDVIRKAYGRSLSIPALSKAIKRLPVHPNIRPPQVGQIQARANPLQVDGAVVVAGMGVK